MFGDKSITLPVQVSTDTVWLNRSQLAELFGRDVKTIGKHIGNALKEELEESEVVAKFATTTRHGAIEGKTQTHLTEYYNLDMIISVGYRVKSKRGVEFRRWANKVLKQYILQGYAVNQKRLNQLIRLHCAPLKSCFLFCEGGFILFFSLVFKFSEQCIFLNKLVKQR